MAFAEIKSSWSFSKMLTNRSQEETAEGQVTVFLGELRMAPVDHNFFLKKKFDRDRETE